MPVSVRWRLTIAIGALLVAALLVYTVIVRSLEVAQHAQDDDDDLIRSTERLATRIHQGYSENWTLTAGEDTVRPPTATEALLALVESVNGYIWVIDRHDITFYSSNSVRAIDEETRSVLDTLVASIPKAAVVGPSGAVNRVADSRVTRLTSTRPELLLYSVGVDFRPLGVNRVVLARTRTPVPSQATVLALSLAIALPLVLMAAFASAGAFASVATHPIDTRIDKLMNEVEAISDGRSLHRRVPGATESDPSDGLTRLAHTLNAMIARLEQSFSGLRRFTADASHELKTPLTVLRADVERAMTTQGNAPEQLVALEEALAETARMSDLVDSLLTLARADEGRFDLHREPVDLRALAYDVFETATLLGERTRIVARMDPPPVATVLGDVARLRQLLLNLVTNAIKYTPPGGTVQLSLVVTESTAQFSVRDSGIGIAAADQAHVFERFWRADHARSRVGERGGFGLGLAISQYIAQAHGGSLTLQSRLGRGSIFTVALPLQRSTDSPGQNVTEN